jgi:hypothetical protein
MENTEPVKDVLNQQELWCNHQDAKIRVHTNIDGSLQEAPNVPDPNVLMDSSEAHVAYME